MNTQQAESLISSNRDVPRSHPFIQQLLDPLCARQYAGALESNYHDTVSAFEDMKSGK